MIQSIVTEQTNMTFDGNFFESSAYNITPLKNTIDLFRVDTNTGILYTLMLDVENRCEGVGGRRYISEELVLS